MLVINQDGTILLTRGDSAYIDVSLFSLDGERYELQSGDVLTLTVRKEADDMSPVLLQVTSDTGTIVLTPEQTKQMRPGSYSHGIRLTTAAGDVFTIAGTTKQVAHLNNFIILPEVSE